MFFPEFGVPTILCPSYLINGILVFAIYDTVGYAPRFGKSYDMYKQH